MSGLWIPGPEPKTNPYFQVVVLGHVRSRHRSLEAARKASRHYRIPYFILTPKGEKTH